MTVQSLVDQPGRNNKPALANGVYPVYLQNAPETVVLAVAAALSLTTNRTLSTNLVGTTATNTFTIAAPPCTGFLKTVIQVNSGAGTITPISGVNIFNNTSIVTSVAVPAKSSVQLLGVGGDWHVVETNTPNTAPALAGSLSPVYLLAKPETVTTSGAAAVTTNVTFSTNATGTTALTLVAPPVDGFVKRIYQIGAGASTVTASGGTIINNGVTSVVVNIAATASVTLIGSGGNWYVVDATGAAANASLVTYT